MRRRREVIKGLGAATVAFAGCTELDPDGAASGTPEGSGEATGGPTPSTDDPLPAEISDRYGTVHDVQEAGLDPDGQTLIDGRVSELAADDTLLFFPEGTYRVGQLDLSDRTNLGLYGDGATLKLDTSGRHIFLILRDVADVHVEGFSIDNGASNTAAWCDLKCVGGTNTIRDYAVEGFVDVDERTNGFTLMVEGEDTSLELDEVDLRHGARNGAAVFVFPRRDFYDPDREPGSLTFRNCVMNGWGKEGLYASAHSGPLRVLGGEYRNNAIGQVRIGGGDAPTEAVVRGVTVRVTSIPDYMPEENRILRGIWLKEGDGALIEDCTVEIANVGRNETQGGIIVNDQFGRATIRNCRLRTDVERPAIVIDPPEDEYDPSNMPSLSSLPPEWGVVCEGVEIEGQSPNTEAISVHDRSGCEFRDVTIDTDGEAGDGVRFYGVPAAPVENSTIRVGRFPLAFGFPEDLGSCAYRLTDTDVRGSHLSEVGSALERADDGVFCLDGSAVPDGWTADDPILAVTQTEQASGGEERVLYGRWFDSL